MSGTFKRDTLRRSLAANTLHTPSCTFQIYAQRTLLFGSGVFD